jgi:ribonuclease inhibitor
MVLQDYAPIGPLEITMNIEINGFNITSAEAFHKQIAKLLPFPDYYGKNLYALWDVLTTDIERPLTIIWKNSEVSKQSMKNDFKHIVEVLRRVEIDDLRIGLTERFELILS